MSSSTNSQLTDEEVSTFKRIAERFEGEAVGEVAATLVQSASNEEASS